VDSQHQNLTQLPQRSSRNDQWYVSKNEKEYGPIPFSNLAKFAKQRLLLEDDWVWRHGLEQWMAAKNVPGLFEPTDQLHDGPERSNRAVSEERRGLEYKRSLKERLLDSAKTFVLMFMYLWLVFGLLALHESVILSQNKIDYQSHGLAVVNALIFAKVMLVAEDLRLGHRFNEMPLIYPILLKSFLFAVALILFHIIEHVLIGMWHGRAVAETFSEIGAGNLIGIASNSVIATFALVPFFVLREISRVIGVNRFWALFFRRRNS
jgi:hypothetical protein